MGSPKVSNAKPQLPMENKPVKTVIASFMKFFKDSKKDKTKYQKNIKIKEEETTNTDAKTEHKNENEVAVANILKRFKNLDIKVESKEKQIKDRKNSTNDDEDDQFSHFKSIVIEDDRKRHSSEDSGYSEAKEEYSKEDQEVIDSFDKLKIKDHEEKEESKKDEDKDKKTKQVVVSRAPVRPKLSSYNVDPYPAGQVKNQINQQALSGGQVFIAAPQDDYIEVVQALQLVEEQSQTTSDQSAHWQDVLDLIDKDSQSNETEDFLNTLRSVDFLQEFNEFVNEQSNNVVPNVTSNIIPNVGPNVPNVIPDIVTPNDIEEFDASNNLPNDEITSDLNNTLLSYDNVPGYNMEYIFPTPPRSEMVPSPMSESQASIYPPSSAWENSLSPDRSSPLYHSDYERYQEISSFELSPVSENDEQRQRIDSTSSLSRNNSVSRTMKNYKDMQKEIANKFSEMDCCQMNRKTCKELFEENMSQLKVVDKKDLCFNVAKMDMKSAHGVLQHIIRKAASGSDQAELQYALFALVLQRVLAQSPALFVGDFGLSILKSAVMRCPHRPLLTRFIVSSIYTALRQQSAAVDPGCVFDEVDALGDNLIIACARGGDAYALVLAEITRADSRGDLPPLFRIHHANTDGYTALHVASSLHSAASPRLHTLHVLLQHAHAELWKGDVKGGDTAVHLAVNSANCDLNVVLMMFKYVDRKMWKKLAFCQNMSSVTPLEYARSAAKSTTRQNYPQDVLNFLKKCR